MLAEWDWFKSVNYRRPTGLFLQAIGLCRSNPLWLFLCEAFPSNDPSTEILRHSRNNGPASIGLPDGVCNPVRNVLQTDENLRLLKQ